MACEVDQVVTAFDAGLLQYVHANMNQISCEEVTN